MHLYVDSADLAGLEPLLELPIVHGVTTNPTLLSRSGIDGHALSTFARRVLELGAGRLHLQVTSDDRDRMVRQGREFASWGDAGQIVVKVPATRAGLTAARRLADEDIPTTLTAVFALEQALWGALVGAAYIAPYFGRMNDAGQDGLAIVDAMQRLLDRRGGLEPRLLVASVRTREDFLALLKAGVGGITVPPRLMGEVVDHEATLAAERVFLADARGVGT